MLRGISRYCLVLCGIVWHYVVVSGTAFCRMVLRDIVRWSVLLRDIMCYCVVLCGTGGSVWYCVVLCCNAWYCVVLFGVARFFVLLRGISWTFAVLRNTV